MARRRKTDPRLLSPDEGVGRVLDDDQRICWFPVRHFSAAAAVHVEEVIGLLQPDAVLVEGPDDATALLPALVDEGTEAPVSVLSTWVDKRNQHGLNGVLTASAEVPVRYRGWWPFVRYSPELVALRAGAAIGAELGFIDAPLRATLPFQQAKKRKVSAAVDDQRLAENTYFEALRRKRGLPDFDAFWQAELEVRGVTADPLEWMRAVLTFAWCTRQVGNDAALEQDGTLLRERHMRWHVDQARKRHAGWIVVVTGAFHSVALPFTKGKRAREKADRATTTLLCAHSYPALSRLYDQNKLPAYGAEVWEAIRRQDPRPHATAARALLVGIAREARERGLPVSTADAVGAWRVALQLADLRGTVDPTWRDVLDAAQMAYVKGEAHTAGAVLKPLAQQVLVGRRIGRVSALAGQVPLLSSFYEEARSHRIDVSGAHKVVRCDIGRSAAHRRKSAFLHRADWLELPMFASADRTGRRSGHFRGPNPAEGEDLHLLGETWGIRWQEVVDDRLIELADRGATLAEVATVQVREELAAAKGDARATAALLVRTVQMLLPELFDDVLLGVEDALEADRRFLHLTDALQDFVVLHELRAGLATHGLERLLVTLGRTWTAAVLQLHQLAGVEDLQAGVHALQDVVRLAIGFDAVALDLEMLVEQLERLAALEQAPPAVLGATLGALYTLGHRRERDLADALRRTLEGREAQDAGAFLEGLFLVGRSSLLGGPHLLAAVDEVLAGLDWATFRELLPDLRRAFTHFVPSELRTLGARVSAQVGLARSSEEAPVPEGLRAWSARADRRASDAWTAWVARVGLPPL